MLPETVPNILSMTDHSREQERLEKKKEFILQKKVVNEMARGSHFQ